MSNPAVTRRDPTCFTTSSGDQIPCLPSLRHVVLWPDRACSGTAIRGTSSEGCSPPSDLLGPAGTRSSGRPILWRRALFTVTASPNGGIVATVAQSERANQHPMAGFHSDRRRPPSTPGDLKFRRTLMMPHPCISDPDELQAPPLRSDPDPFTPKGTVTISELCGIQELTTNSGYCLAPRPGFASTSELSATRTQPFRTTPATEWAML